MSKGAITWLVSMRDGTRSTTLSKEVGLREAIEVGSALTMKMRLGKDDDRPVLDIRAFSGKGFGPSLVYIHQGDDGMAKIEWAHGVEEAFAYMTSAG